MEISIIIICLILAALFSGMEIAFVSSNKIYLEIEKKQQQFGNILLSSTQVNEKYVDFQCLCHFFVDRQYTEVEPIQYLFEMILENG